MAAWSIFFTASLTTASLSSAFASIAALAFFIAVLRAVLRALLLAALVSLTNTHYFADLMLAILFHSFVENSDIKAIKPNFCHFNLMLIYIIITSVKMQAFFYFWAYF